METTVLHLDPRDDRRKARTTAVVSAGYRVVEAATGDEAVELALSERPRVAILSAGDACVNECQVAARIRASDEAAPRILILCPPDWGGVAGSPVLKYADSCLLEPVDLDVLLIQVRTLARLWQADRLARQAATDTRLPQTVEMLQQRAERERAERALQRSLTVLAQAGQMANLGAWDIDLANPDDVNANTLEWSDQVYRIFGYEPGEVAVSNDLFFRHVHPDDRGRVAGAVAQALRERRRSYGIELRIVRRDGRERVVFEQAQIETDPRGRPCRITGAVQDITDRKQAEEALREADRRKDEFLAILSHELRNPLAPIRYALPLLQGEPLSDAARRALAVVERQVTDLTRLVDDLLDVSRITSGKIELRRKPVTLDSVMKAAVEAALPAITAGRHALETKVPDETIWLDADATRITQVLTNLLNNAAKYTPRGGHLVLQAERDGAEAVVRVRDDGIGIQAEALPTVFEMFRQVKPGGDALQENPQAGLGIGLGLARRLVEMHGGTIEARSAGRGAGSEFIVRLPVARPAVARAAADEMRGSAKGPRKLTVLVVDDNVDLVEMLATLLKASGHEVRKALDGGSAVAAALSCRPDVVLLDLGLPVMNGIEVARELRRHPETARARLVALTGWGQAEDRRRTAEAGFDAHLTKPTDPDRLERLLAEFAGMEGVEGAANTSGARG